MAEEKQIVFKIDADGNAAVKEIDKVTDAVSDIKPASENATKSVGRISKGFKGLGVAMKAAGIGLIIGALTSMKEIFSENQRVVDTFSTVFETFSIVINQVVSAFINVYDAVAKSSENFNGLKNVLSGLLTIAVTPLKLAFNGIKLGLQEAQLVWEKSFFGDKDPETIKTLNAEILETKLRIAEVGVEAINAGKDVINNFGDAVGEVVNIGTLASEELSKVSIKAAYEQAQTNVELKNSAELAAAQQGFLISQLEKQAEEQRKIRDDESVSINDRIKANDKLLEITKESNEAFKTQADLQIAAAQAQFDKTGKIEDEIALTDALTNKQDLLNQIQSQQIEQNTNKVALDKEQIELTNSMLESESLLSIERKRFNAEQITDEIARLEALKEIDLLEAEQETARLQAIVDNANAGTQAKIDAQIALDDFTEQSRQTNLTRDTELETAKKDLDNKTKDAKIKNLEAVSGALNGLSALAGKNAQAQKIIGIAQATIDTFIGANKALAQGGIAGPIAAAGIIASGIANVATIVKTKIPNSSGGAGTAAPAAPVAPSFNIVGQTGTNQLAQSLGQNEQQPVQAFVVASQVTTQQSFDNNIVETATLG